MFKLEMGIMVISINENDRMLITKSKPLKTLVTYETIISKWQGIPVREICPLYVYKWTSTICMLRLAHIRKSSHSLKQSASWNVYPSLMMAWFIGPTWVTASDTQ